MHHIGRRTPLRLQNNNIFTVFRFSRTTNTSICLTAYQCTQKKNSKEICLWCPTMNSVHKLHTKFEFIQQIILSISFKIPDDKWKTQILNDFKIIKQNMLMMNYWRLWFIVKKGDSLILLFWQTVLLRLFYLSRHLS